MERVRKTFFDPLATSKARVREILKELPVGSAHPFSPERLLLCRTDSGIDEIDISSYPDDFFFNAVDLGEMGEILLRRMAGFQPHLGMSSLVLLQENFKQRVNTKYQQGYSRTSKSYKHQPRRSRSRYCPAKLQSWQSLKESPLTTISASRMHHATRVAGTQHVPFQELLIAAMSPMEIISYILSRSNRRLSQRKKSACSYLATIGPP